MIELPEALSLAKQINEALKGKTIKNIFNATSLHKFTFFYGDPLLYEQMLNGKKIISAEGKGIFTTILFNKNIQLSINDGVKLKYNSENDKIPSKYQLLLTFDDDSFLTFTVAMYGGISVYDGEFDNEYYRKSMTSVNPIKNEFNESYFDKLISTVNQDLSLKAFLATKQRIPGLGNGTLQDILFNASLNPRNKLSTLNESDKKQLFNSIKTTLSRMIEGGGRNTETDLYGNNGRYATILSKNTYKNPCTKCGSQIIKESYLGGTIYYCPTCQPLLSK